MPKITAANNRGTGLSQRDSENIGNVKNIKGKGVIETRTRSGNSLKRQAEEQSISGLECNAKARRRAALGEITNVSRN